MSVDAEQAKIDKARKDTEDLIVQNRAEREKREAAEAAKGKENPEKKDQGPKAPAQDKGKKDQNKGGRKPVVPNMKKKRVEEEEDEDDDQEEEEQEVVHPKKKGREMIEISDDDEDVEEKDVSDGAMMKQMMTHLRNLRKQIKSAGSQDQDQLVLPSTYNWKTTERNVKQIHGIRRTLTGSFLFNKLINFVLLYFD